ncbi:MAG: hypothetical protein MZV70_21185 [Desulfobacterales bacterium]|nr:hypothetical protein [Desulfobacterales bacterium]
MVWGLLYIVLTGTAEGEDMTLHPEHSTSRAKTWLLVARHGGHRLLPGLAGLHGDRRSRPAGLGLPAGPGRLRRVALCHVSAGALSPACARTAGAGILPAQGPDDPGGQMKKAACAGRGPCRGAGGLPRADVLRQQLPLRPHARDAGRETRTRSR